MGIYKYCLRVFVVNFDIIDWYCILLIIVCKEIVLLKNW